MSLSQVLHTPQVRGMDVAALLFGQYSFSKQSSAQSLLSVVLLFFPFAHVKQCPGSDAKVSHNAQPPQENGIVPPNGQNSELSHATHRPADNLYPVLHAVHVVPSCAQSAHSWVRSALHPPQSLS